MGMRLNRIVDASDDLRGRRHSGRESSRLATAAVLCGLILSPGISPVKADESGGAAEALLRLVPPDATVVVTVEGLRDRVRELSGSRLVSNLRRLPAVRAWFQSEHYRNLERAGHDIEAGLGVGPAELRDDLIGDAAVLVLRLDPDAVTDPSRARGLLLVRARDRGLLERLIAVVNTSQRQNGELDRVTDRTRGGATYHLREFPAASGRQPEWYVSYPDGTFAFSNSEALIQGVIDRKARTSADRSAPDRPGLADLPKFRAVQRRLPERPLARLFVDPRALEKLLAAVPRSSKPSEIRVLAMLERYLAAVDYGGAALTCGPDAIVIHAVETIDVPRLEPWLRRWAGDPRGSDAALRRVPPTALALASAHVDATALRDAVYQLIPTDARQPAHNLETVATGLLLGQDLRSRILPALGPGLVAYIDSPIEPPAKDADPAPPAGRGSLFPVVVVIGLSQEPPAPPRDDRDAEPPPTVAVAAAIDNALRTILALAALDEKRGGGRSRIVTRDVAGAIVTTLDVPLPFAFAVDRARGRLVLGSSAVAVARYLESWADPEAGRRFREIQSLAFADAETFACVDLDALTGLADRYRDRLARSLAARQKRPTAEVEKDLDHVLALARLFRAAFLASRIEADATAVHRSIGVILHHEDRPPGARR